MASVVGDPDKTRPALIDSNPLTTTAIAASLASWPLSMVAERRAATRRAGSGRRVA
ncbi:MAG: hypothetical protein ACRD0D_09890 [Acidimicrobiales bacterium]